MGQEIVIHVIHPDDGVRHSISFMLALAGFAVRFHGSLNDFLALPGSISPGCIVVGREPRSPSETQCLHELRTNGTHLPVVFVAKEGDIPTAVAAMKAGAADFLQMPFEPDTLVNAVRVATDTKCSINTGEHGEASDVRARMSRLTPREANVMRGVVGGLPNKSIAHELRISPRTVEVHRANVMAKMNARSVAELVRLAMIVENDFVAHLPRPDHQRSVSHTY
ncbi:LuxR C-terminal-related transcriptional regulator [Rhizobium sp. EC-SD404]|uniref:response regulator transcription factor n=1 Tax=Rhizobium sp. EC-SD404 TaxID=2038389 RepID=UPI0012530469|nr:LuxR C-terminal-related transcriptional regulator [Rhizobium sp. EC-SD404]VVT03452.1 Transcriptional regulatory protein FixJ [Rhizobium sp. EC-SD404]